MGRLHIGFILLHRVRERTSGQHRDIVHPRAIIALRKQRPNPATKIKAAKATEKKHHITNLPMTISALPPNLPEASQGDAHQHAKQDHPREPKCVVRPP
jgi:hypothetical protein